ncbi:Crp/Fnr family transcriptional regulator [Fenollaria sporofastidiosus]|uniref:Crp/Fnr family transcriptional regulator n=1 Tax=Fenollaria sporofastidiosus TaxID=2811778 RepID=UPI001BFFF858|nr:Crp/Fnr family transcriptional regulator [Fenollaria sporofastidiosus]
MRILNFKLFEGISKKSKAEIESLDILVKTFESGEKVFSKDSDLKYAMFIESGCLKACEYNINGKEIVSSYYVAGDAFPFYLYFGNTHELPYDVYATRKTTVYFLPLQDFEKIMDTDIVLTKNILKFVAEYTCFNKLVIRATQYSKVSQRLAYWILHLEEVDYLKMPSSQIMLSDILRVNRPSLNQELKKFSEDKAISVDGMDIRILNRDYLRKIID